MSRGAHTDGGFVEIDATNMPGLYRLDLPGCRKQRIGQISLLAHGAANMAPAPARLFVDAPANKGVIEGKATGGLSTTSMETDLSGYADDELIGALLIFTSGDADGQRRAITDYANTSGVVTLATLQNAPAVDDEFIIV